MASLNWNTLWQSGKLKKLKNFKQNLGLNFLLFLLILLSAPVFPQKNEVLKATRSFFADLNQQNYPKAYNRLSFKLRRQVGFAEFKTTAESIEAVKVLEYNISELYNNLCRIKLKAKVRLWYEGELYDAVYQGKASLVKEKNLWKLDACALEPIKQNPAKPGKSPGKIEFLSQ